MLAWKGPLVDGSSWVPFFPDDFHRGCERFTHIQLSDRLREDSPPRQSLASWQELRTFAGEATDELVARNGHPDVIFVSGTPSPILYTVLDPYPAAPLSIRSTELGDVRDADIVGTVRNIPVFRLWGSEADPTCAYVLDLARSYRYTQTNPDAMSDEDLYLRVEPVTFEKAVELLEKNPELLQPGDGPRLTREEQVVRLQLEVILHVIEGGRVESVEPAFAIGALVEIAADVKA
jgi:hypothetical protein